MLSSARAKFLSIGLLLILALTGIAACGPSATADPAPTSLPTAQPTVEPTPSIPAATPTSEPTTEPTPSVPTRAPVAVGSLDHPVELLSGLPSGASTVAFVEFVAVSQRPSLRGLLDDQLMSLVYATNEILDEQQVKSSGITSAAFGINNWSDGAAILLGDFRAFPDILREAAAAGTATLQTYRGLELFAVTDYHDLYIAMPDSGTLLLAQGDEATARQLLEETIDRYLDGSELDESLAGLLGHTGPIVFLVAKRTETEDGAQGGRSFPLPKFFAGAGTLNEGDTSTLYLYYEFDDPAQAEQIESQMTGEEELQGYNSGENYPITETRRDGRAVIAQAVVLDIDLGGLLLGN